MNCFFCMLKISIKPVIFLLLACMVMPANADNIRYIQILLSSQAGPYESFALSLKSRIQSDNADTEISISTLDNQEDTDKNTVIIPVGYPAAKYIAGQKSTNPIIYTLISEESYKKLTDKSQDNHTAIYINQSWKRQFSSIKYITPSLGKIAILYSKNTKHLLPQIQESAKQASVKIKFYNVNDSDNIIKVVNEALHGNDALLAIPDHTIFNKNTAKNILYASYKLKKPLIAYSKNYVKAGALLSVYSTLDNYAQQAAEIVNKTISGTSITLPGADYPRYFEIEINESVAKSLDIKHTNPIKQKELIH